MSFKPLGTVDGIAVWCAHDRIVPIEELVPNARNPNKHPAEQLQLYLKIIKAHGWRRAIVVSKQTGLIVRGHGAYMAMQLGKLTAAPVNFQDYETPASELEDLLADNELARLAAANESDLNELLAELTDPELAGVLKKIELPAVLRDIEIKPPPKMAWVLIGIPLVKFSRINALVEQIAKEPEAIVESTMNDKVPKKSDGYKKDGQSRARAKA